MYKLSEAGLFGDNLPQEVTFKLNMKDNCKINKGKGGQKKYPKEKKLQVQKPWGDSIMHFRNLKAARKVARGCMREGGKGFFLGRGKGFFLGSRLEPDYAGPCRQQEAMGSQKCVIGEAPFSCRCRTDWSGKEWLQAPGLSVRGIWHKAAAAQWKEEETHTSTQQELVRGWGRGVKEGGASKMSLTATEWHDFQDTGRVQSFWQNTTSSDLMNLGAKIISTYPKELHAFKVQTSGKKGFQKRRTI